tara:strand:+ start:11876 stop:12172 length:297 start_codon:yes stop_codon:yes gene_type:complete
MRNGGHWRDTHGTFEHHLTYGFAREVASARDCAADGNVAQHHQEVFELGMIEPLFATPERQSKLDPFAEKLAGWLKTEAEAEAEAEAGKSRKQRRTLK